MKGFNAGVYLRRVLKYVIFYTVFILALLALVYFTGDNHSISFGNLFAPIPEESDFTHSSFLCCLSVYWIYK